MTCKTNSIYSAMELQEFQIKNETGTKAVLLTIHKLIPVELDAFFLTTALRFGTETYFRY